MILRPIILTIEQKQALEQKVPIEVSALACVKARNDLGEDLAYGRHDRRWQESGNHYRN